MANVVANIDRAATVFAKKRLNARAYVNHRSFPNSIKNSIEEYYEFLWKRQKGLAEEEVFEMLPSSLSLAARMEISNRMLRNSALLKKIDSSFLRGVAQCLSSRILLPKLFVWRIGQVGRELFFVKKGRVEILGMSTSGRRADVQIVTYKDEVGPLP